MLRYGPGICRITPIVLAALLAAGPSPAQPQDNYVGLFGGYQFRADDTWSSSVSKGTIGNADGPVAGARLGTTLAEGTATRLRIEGEFSWRRNRVDGLTSRRFKGSAVAGHISALAVMANAYLDLGRPDARIRPFVGAGLGWARLHHKTQDKSAALVPVDYFQQVDAHTNRLAWQAMAGASVGLTKGLNMTLEVRHTRITTGQLMASTVPIYRAGHSGTGLLAGLSIEL